MKKKISIAAVIVAVILGIYFVFAPTPVGENGPETLLETDETLRQTEPDTGGTAPEPENKAQQDTEATAPTGVEMDERVRRMREEYAVLEDKRQELRDRLNDIRGQLWGVELPRKQANEVNNEMKEGFILLKSPPMLGAFHDAGEVRDEIGRIEKAMEDLDGIEEIIQTAKNSEE